MKLGGGGGHELKDVAGLLTAGFDDGQERFDEATALSVLGAEAEFTPDDRRTKCSLADVVGGLDAFVVEERPQSAAVLQQSLAGARGLRVTTAQPAKQRSFDPRRARESACVSGWCE